MGIPVITNTGVGDVEEIVSKYNSGYVLKNFSDESFDGVIDKIISGNSFSKNEIRNGAVDFYALDIAVERYKKVYEKIFDKD